MKDEPLCSNHVGLFFDQTRCTGCFACTVACKDWHDIPAGPTFWKRIFPIERGKYPNPFLAFQGQQCYHCVQAPCLFACPAEAIHKSEETGIVVVNQEQCLGRDDCGHPCSYECPAGNDVLGFISQIQKKNFAEAWRTLIETNPLPGVCGRVCYHSCESVCTRGQIDEPLAIHALERFVSSFMPTLSPFRVEWKQNRVAVIGSGPAGLSCAYHLARRGYRVTIYEALPVLGGMLRVGIPQYRLPKDVLEREIQFIISLGIEIKTNMCLGKNLSFEDLDRFDAVFLATGAHQEKLPNIAGTELKGVLSGIGFLKEINLNGKARVGKRLAVLGGGNVAFDCARSGLRMGADEIHLICPEREQEMRADFTEIQQATEEGIILHASEVISRILGRSGRVQQVELMRLESMEVDPEGKPKFEAVAGSEYLLSIDTVILAIGQDANLDFLPENILVQKGMICVDINGATSRPKVFAGGDVTSLQRRVVWAIGAGRKAAAAIDNDLQKSYPEKIKEKYSGKSKMIDTDFMVKKKRVAIPMLPLDHRRQTFSEVEKGLDRHQAEAEASRCLLCQGMCSIACPYGAPQFGAEDNPKMHKCDFCLEEWSQGKVPICVRSCTMRALDAAPLEQLKLKHGNRNQAEGFTYYTKSEPAVIFKPKFYKDES